MYCGSLGASEGPAEASKGALVGSGGLGGGQSLEGLRGSGGP